MEQEPILFTGYNNINIKTLFKDIQNTFTYEFWVKPLKAIYIDTESLEGASGTVGQKFVIGPGFGEKPQNAGTGVSVGTNGVIVYEHSGHYLPALLVYPMSITEWTHIAVVYRNKTPYLYINGEFKKKGLTSPKENVYASGLLGGLEPYGNYVGYLRYIKIWDCDKSECEIKSNMEKLITGEEKGLFRYWTFDGGAIRSNVNDFDPLYLETYKKDLKILFVNSGNGVPYTPLENSIIKTLKEVVCELKVGSPDEDLLGISKIMKPDIALFFSPGVSLQCDQIEELKKQGIKTALWLTDDPYYIDITKSKASCFDVVFTQEYSCVPLYQSVGCPKVYYLPLAADPDVFHPKIVNPNYESDILFVGCAFWNRVNLFDSIARYLYKKNVIILGLYWERLKNYGLLKGKIHNTWASPEETASYYNGAKIVINIHRLYDDSTININTQKVNANSVNPRTFEISACGAFQLTDIREGLTSFYKPGVDIATYSSPNDLIRKIEYYLNHEAERKAIALNGLNKTQEEHTFLNRINSLLNIAWE